MRLFLNLSVSYLCFHLHGIFEEISVNKQGSATSEQGLRMLLKTRNTTKHTDEDNEKRPLPCSTAY